MNTVSFISANFVARELHYQMRGGWGEGDTATNAFFRPEETFSQRFDEMLAEVSTLGFEAIDLWSAHLNPAWATLSQIETAARLLAARGLTVSSMMVWVSDDLDQFESIAAVAKGVGARILCGGCHPTLLAERRADFLAALEKHDLIFGYENHPEKTAAELLAKIGEPAGGRIGLAIDTGWFGTQGYPAAIALRELAGRIVHLHLKDIHRPEPDPASPTLKAMGHETCALGDGCVGIAECVATLREIDYQGGIAIEHEPEDHNPMPEVAESLQRLLNWLRA